MTKSKNGTSSAGEELFEAILDISGAEYSKTKYGYGEELEEAAKQRITELVKPITAEKCRAIGAPAEDAGNTSHGGGTTQLRDTAKSPNAINASAHAERLHLAKDARCLDLAADMTESVQPQNSMERALAHQIAAAHALAMRLMDKAVIWLDDAKPAYGNPDKIAASVEAVRLANASARLMKASQEGMLVLAKLRGGGQQQVTVVHQHVQVAGGNVAVTGHLNRGDGNGAGE
jgi:hypothetical protein